MSEPLKARIVFDQPIAQPQEPLLRGAHTFDDQLGEHFVPVATEIAAEEQEGQTEALLSRALKPRRSLWRKIARLAVGVFAVSVVAQGGQWVHHIAQAYTHYLTRCKDQGLHFIQPGRFVLPGDLAGAPALQFFPWPQTDKFSDSELAQADKHSNIGMLRTRFDYYCQHIVKGFYKEHFARFDRQIVLVDCLQPLNSGPQAFNDMRLALTQLMQSFNYGKRTLLRRLFAPCIDKLMFAATKADHITGDQHTNLVALLQQLVQEAWQNAAFEGISMDCVGLASVQATESGMVDYQGQSMPAVKGQRLSDGQPLTLYPGDVPARLPEHQFWARQGFNFEQFRPRQMNIDQPLPHIRLDAVLEFLLGDKMR